MRHVEIEAVAGSRTAADIYPLLCDFERYQYECEAVRTVTITGESEGHAVSEWEVNFRQGILRWTEEDFFDPEAFTIRFEQTEGDAEHFSGAWLMFDTEDGCLIRFIADFDMGVPSISDIIEPIAEQALRENIHSILDGMLEGQVAIVSPSPLP